MKVTLRTDHKGDKYTDADREVIREALPRWQDAGERGKQLLCREVATKLKRTVGGVQRRLRELEIASQEPQPTSLSTRKRAAVEMEGAAASGERPHRAHKPTQFFHGKYHHLQM
jgi:hypothetical protein